MLAHFPQCLAVAVLLVVFKKIYIKVIKIRGYSVSTIKNKININICFVAANICEE